MRFTKMQGCGNDYVYVNCFEESVSSPQQLAKAVSDRHFGIGSDGLVLICPSEKADCRMRMFNPDGSEAVDGLKTGYIDAGGSSIVITGKRDGQRVIAVVLGSQTSALRDEHASRLLRDALGSVGW